MLLRRTLELSISRDEFLRLLRGAVDDFEVTGDSIECPGAHVHATIRLTRLADRQLGDIAVARHLVEIRLDASCEAEAEAFMDRFDRAFLRGGA